MMSPRPISEPPASEIDWTLDPEAALEMGSPDAARQQMSDVNRQLGSNVLATIVARIVNMARGVCIVPFLLAHIGLEAYGIWTTIFILVSYVGLTTLGISNVYIKYVAEFHARREYDKANALLSTGLAVTIPLCTAVFLVFWLGWAWIGPLLRLPPARAGEGKEASLIVLGVYLSSIALNAFNDVLTGTQRIVSTQVFVTISIVVECAVIVWLVSAGRGIRGLAEAYLVRTAINDGLSIWWAKRQLKWLHLSLRQVRRESLKYVVHFGGLVQLQSMLSIFLASVERVVALVLIGAAAAGLLDVAKKWPVSLSAIPTAFFAALLPAASHVDAHLGAVPRRACLRAGQAGPNAPGRARRAGQHRGVLRRGAGRADAPGAGRRGADRQPARVLGDRAGTSGRGGQAAARSGGHPRRWLYLPAALDREQPGAAAGLSLAADGPSGSAGGGGGGGADARPGARRGGRHGRTVAYATTVRPFDADGLRSLEASCGAVVLVEPYLAGTSAFAVSSALASRPHRLLSLGVQRTNCGGTGRPATMPGGRDWTRPGSGVP